MSADPAAISGPMRLFIICDGCGATFRGAGEPCRKLEDAERLREEARAAGWSGDMNRLSAKDKCAKCTAEST